jgi:putative membrane protein
MPPANTRFARYLIPLAVLFHLVGLLGILFADRGLFSILTPFHLLLMGLLLAASFASQFKGFISWALMAYIIGFGAEWLGVHTGLLFGNYHYESGLGLKFLDVPIVIGLNWLIVITGAVAVAQRITTNLLLVCLLAGLIATGYDFILEPVAQKLRYWQWTDGRIPAWNYICWGMLSASLAARLLLDNLKTTAFSLWLFVIQLIFFLILRIAL